MFEKKLFIKIQKLFIKNLPYLLYQKRLYTPGAQQMERTFNSPLSPLSKACIDAWRTADGAKFGQIRQSPPRVYRRLAHTRWSAFSRGKMSSIWSAPGVYTRM